MNRLLAVSLALALPLSANAADHSFTFLEAGIAQDTLEGSEEAYGTAIVATEEAKLRGHYFKASLELGETLFLFGGQVSGDDKDIGVTVDDVPVLSYRLDAKEYNVGLGGRFPLNEQWHVVGKASYLRTRIDLEEYEVADGDDYRIGVGVHGTLAGSLEGWLEAGYTDGDVYDGDASATVGAQYRFTPTWGLVGEVELGNGELKQRATIGLRASF